MPHHDTQDNRRRFWRRPSRFLQSTRWLLAGLLLTPCLVLAQGTLPEGPQFQVNTFTPDHQVEPDVAINAAGDFVVVWTSYASDNGDTDDRSIQARRYQADGTPLGPQFRVNTYTGGRQFRPAVGVDDQGRFVVVWQSYGGELGDTSNSSVQGRRFQADGSPLGEQFRVNLTTESNQGRPDVAINGLGDFVVVWESDGPDNHDLDFGIRGQRFAADGASIGPEMAINTYTLDFQGSPKVAMDALGGFVVVWRSFGDEGGDDSADSVQGQRLGADGSLIGPQFLVNQYTTGFQSFPDIAMSPTGDFVVTWEASEGAGNDTSPTSIQARRFDAQALSLGPDFQVNTYTYLSQNDSAVAMDPDGGFVVTWQSIGQGDEAPSLSIQGRRYAADGNPVGDQLRINTYTPGWQLEPAVTMNAEGKFVVVWTSEASETDPTSGSIQGQRFCDPVCPLFADGFESGDTDGWSSRHGG